MQPSRRPFDPCRSVHDLVVRSVPGVLVWETTPEHPEDVRERDGDHSRKRGRNPTVGVLRCWSSVGHRLLASHSQCHHRSLTPITVRVVHARRAAVGRSLCRLRRRRSKVGSHPPNATTGMAGREANGCDAGGRDEGRPAVATGDRTLARRKPRQCGVQRSFDWRHDGLFPFDSEGRACNGRYSAGPSDF